MRKIPYTGPPNETDLHKEVTHISKQNPTKIVTYYVQFCQAVIYLHDHKPRTDTLDSAMCYRTHGGFFKNGRIVPPTKTWLKKYNFVPYLG